VVAHELRSALGGKTAGTGKTVETPVQSGRSSRADKDQDRQNKGFSGTPLWKIKKNLEAASEAASLKPGSAVPDGFALHDGDLYWSEKRQVFWQQSTGRFLVFDERANSYAELHEGLNFELSILAGGAMQDGPTQVRRVLVRDLLKAGQALRMPIDHLDRPCALYAFYEGHDVCEKAGNACADFCAKHLHEKLLAKLAAFRGLWSGERLIATMRESFGALDADLLEKQAPLVRDGCSAVVALVTGLRLVLASIGNVSSVLCMRGGAAANGGLEPAQGDNVTAGPAALKVRVVHLQPEHVGLAIMSRVLFDATGGPAAVSQVLQDSSCTGRPRAASGRLVGAGPVGGGSAAIVTFFDMESSSEASSGTTLLPPAKRPRTDPTQIRLRHIVLKSRDCKNPVDKVRNKPVTRSRAEAERLLCAVLKDCEADPKRRSAVFAQRCRELSECQSSLRGGDMAGDLNWVRRGKMGAAFDEAAFTLQVGQLSDLVDSDAGIHVIWRTA